MRFSSFLPMLLLVGALHAQNQCSIYDLTAKVANYAPSTCQYYITLNFEHTGTTNQFTVTGNGNNYGTFDYSQVPLTLGPFTAGSTPSVKEFVVKDAVYNDCKDDAQTDIPGCQSTSIDCDIYDVKVVPGDCVPGSLTYQLTLNFQVKNPGNDFFEVWAGNGQYLGIFPLSQLPLNIPNFPWDGDPTDHIKICINDNPDCCESVSFPAPDCVQGPCNISNLTVETGGCTSDSTYKVWINFATNTPNILGVFGVWANGSFVGIFGMNDLPLTLDSFPWNGGPVDEVKVCIVNPPTDPANLQILCCKTLEFQVPDCLPVYPCGIKDMKVETDTCSSDSTFGLWVNFLVNDTTAVDSFDVWANGAFLGAFAYDSLPLYIPDFPWNGNIFNHIRVCTGNAPPCCRELQFLAPACLPFGPCEVTDIFVQTGACTSDSTYKLRLNFQATNPGDGNFILWANGTLVDTFPLTAVPLAFDSFPWSGNNVDVVRICISGATPDTVPCCREKEFHPPACLFPDSCEITNVVVDPGDCNSANNSYSLTLNFEVKNATNDFFELWTGNGQYLGYFPLSQLPLKIPAFPCTNNGVGVLKICINDNPDCCTVVEFQAPDCCDATGPCEIYDLTVETGDCTSDSTYHAWINFQVSNPLGDQFSVWTNGDFYGTFDLDSLPLQIPNFPWNGGSNDVVKICFISPNGAVGCCKTKEFAVPDCIDQPCEIYNLTVVTGDCTGDSTYVVKINFQVANPPGNLFGVWANGEFLGTFNVNQLPLTITNFPWNGGNNDVIKVCFVSPNDPAGSATCCRVKEFEVPDCLDQGGPCEIWDLTVIATGDCTGDSTYVVKIDFQVANPPGNTFDVWANGVFFGSYNLNQLPLTITNFPWNGGSNDVVKVCMASNSNTGCCKTKEFNVPGCLNQGGPCEVFDMTVETGDCTGDSTYVVTIDFQVANAPGNVFGVWANGAFLGTFNVNQLPLTITDFPWNGGSNDVVKVCFVNPNGAYVCCRTKEFAVPDCLDPGGPCEIYNLVVDTGDCTGDSTYQVWINFQVDNPPGDQFGVWANGEFLGFFNLNQLPLSISDFPWNGGSNDVVKVCFANSGTTGCCRTKEFEVPDCLNQGGSCHIYDLSVETGDCTGDSTYQVWIDFSVDNPPGNTFGVWANGEFLGTFNLNQLPLAIMDFPWNGGAHDVVKVCFVDPDHPDLPPTCCCTEEFAVPDCLDQGGPCEIYGLVVDTGDCTGDSTYAITINFSVDNPPGNIFGVWANGEFLGTFNLNQLPLTINNFPWNGGSNDVVKVCFVDPDHPDLPPTCCRTKEFEVPDCLNQGGPCEIYNLVVDPGNCTGDSTYSIIINFSVDNPPGNTFGVWANGEFFGTFNLNQLPLTISNFPWNGGSNDVVKVCFVDPDHPDLPPTCCRTKEFEVPDCLTQDVCHIFDLLAIPTPCLCGQFFVAVTFQHENGGIGGFEIVGNGTNYGSFPYNTQQPIILGPLMGDGTTQYEFAVNDVQHPDCGDDVAIGSIDCMTPVVDPGSDSHLVLSPNPATSWLSITAQLQGSAQIGESTVDVYHADGRLVRSFTVPDGGNFQIDVADLPAGVYRLSLQAAAGRLEGIFAKQ